MNGIGLAVLGMAVLAASWGITALVLRAGLARRVLDIPNARSSHLVPTPRGGGIGLVAAGSAALWWLVAGAGLPAATAALTGAALAIAAIGLADDLKPLSARLRLAVQLGAGLALLAALPEAPRLALGGGEAPAWLALAAALGGLAWLTNLYNFMDGIDGLAGLQGVAVGSAAALVLGLAGSGMWPAPLVVAAAAAGFSLWNLPPARIFMGDVGSAWLGFMFAGLALLSSLDDPRLPWCWLVLLAVFVSDASVTLLTRLARGERIHEAHRSHQYQRLTRRWVARFEALGATAPAARARAHRRYSLGAMAVVLIWLLPLAGALALGTLEPLVALLLAYGPLVAAALWLGAGRPGELP